MPHPTDGPNTFGEKLPTLTTGTPGVILYGVTPDDQVIPIQIDDSGVVSTTATLNVGDIEIGAIEVKNYNSDDRLEITVDHEAVAEARLHDGAGQDITSTTIGSKQAIDVNLAQLGAPTNVFGEAVAVETDDPTIFVWYTVPPTRTLYVKHIMASGENIGTYDLLVGTPDTLPGIEPIVGEEVVARRRSYYTHYNVDFTFEAEGELGLKVEAGQVVALRVTHTQIAPDDVADFEGNIYGRLV